MGGCWGVGALPPERPLGSLDEEPRKYSHSFDKNKRRMSIKEIYPKGFSNKGLCSGGKILSKILLDLKL